MPEVYGLGRFRLVPHFRWLWWNYGIPGFAWHRGCRISEITSLSQTAEFCLWVGINLEIKIFPSEEARCGHVTMGFLALSSTDSWCCDRLLPSLHQWICRIWEWVAPFPMICCVQERNRLCLLRSTAARLRCCTRDLEHITQGKFVPTQRVPHITTGNLVGTPVRVQCPSAYRELSIGGMV
jgi:hypothetical protein